jgi:hypothetical protein
VKQSAAQTIYAEFVPAQKYKLPDQSSVSSLATSNYKSSSSSKFQPYNPERIDDSMAQVNHEQEDVSDTSSITDPLDTRDDEGWEDVDQDIEEITVLSLFDDQKFPDARTMLEHCRDNHDFDIWKLRQDFGEYLYLWIKANHY